MRFPGQLHRAHRPIIAVRCCNDQANADRTVRDLPLLRGGVAARFPTGGGRRISRDGKRILPGGEFLLHAIPPPARPVVDRKMAVPRNGAFPR